MLPAIKLVNQMIFKIETTNVNLKPSSSSRRLQIVTVTSGLIYIKKLNVEKIC